MRPIVVASLALLTVPVSFSCSTPSAQTGPASEDRPAQRPDRRAAGDVDPAEFAKRVASEAELLPADQYSVMRMQRVVVKPTHVFRTPSGFLVRFEDGQWANGREGWGRRGSIFVRDSHDPDELLESLEYPPLPKPPVGFTVRTLAELPNQIVRIAHDAQERYIFGISREGALWRVDRETGEKKRLLQIGEIAGGRVETLGLALDDQDRAYIVSNMMDRSVMPFASRVTIYRTVGPATAETVQVQPWLQTSYPYGIGSYNHGVAHAAFGPDGMLYIGSGSRTDANEPSDMDVFSSIGEVELTSCIWRIDPNTENPQIEIYADGLRNPFGFCWDSQGRMVATESGPNAMPPEEINIVEQGKHYGFPWRFSNWSNNPYPHVGEPPPGLEMVDPVINIGPDGIGPNGKPMATLTPHTSPVGICYLDQSWGPELGDSFLVARYGVMVEYGPRLLSDVLLMKLKTQPDGTQVFQTHTFMNKLGRAIDVRVIGKKIYIVEFARVAEPDPEDFFDNDSFDDGSPGRILELAPFDGR